MLERFIKTKDIVNEVHDTKTEKLKATLQEAA